MKHLGKYITVVCFLTMGMLFYVHQHITILRCSYTINKSEQELSTLVDVYKNLKFQLASLSSPSVVEDKLTLADVNLVLPVEIKTVIMPLSPVEQVTIAKRIIPAEDMNIFKFMGFGREAQAEPTEYTPTP